MNNKKNNRKGFTIVELVIVIAVIAILATVLVPTFGNVIQNAKDSAALQEAKNAYTNYVADNATSDEGYYEDVIIETENGFIAVVDGAVVDEVYASLDAAKAAFDTTANDVTTGTAVGKVTPVTVTAKATP